MKHILIISAVFPPEQVTSALMNKHDYKPSK